LCGRLHCTEVTKTRRSLLSGSADALFFPALDRSALLHIRRLCGVQLLVALFDAASPLVAGNGDADMVRASGLAGSGDFLLRPGGCQGKDLIAEARRAALVPTAGFAAVARRRRPDRAPAAAFVAVASPTSPIATMWPSWMATSALMGRARARRLLLLHGSRGHASQFPYGVSSIEDVRFVLAQLDVWTTMPPWRH
jgi:hypothetical protein